MLAKGYNAVEEYAFPEDRRQGAYELAVASNERARKDFEVEQERGPYYRRTARLTSKPDK